MAKLITCPVCGKPKHVREDAKVCSSDCRVKKWREKRKRRRLKMVKVVKEKSVEKLILYSYTPSKIDFPKLNRRQRRDLVYAHPVRRLLDRVIKLRKDMKDADITLPPLPSQRNRKVLSGHMGQLKELVLA